MRVFIDAGHGGRNSGTAVGPTKEKEFVLRFAKKLKNTLENFYKDYNIILSREDDEYLSLQERSRRANEWGADIVICLHVNAHQRADIGGLMCFHLDAVGEEIGSRIMESAPRGLGRTKSKSYLAQPGEWTKDAHACIEGYDAPAVLVELFFATNPSNLSLAITPTGTNGMLVAILHGISLHETNLFFNGNLEDKIGRFT
jgi:N-acetylmuramoyl-L-alanine amidase